MNKKRTGRSSRRLLRQLANKRPERGRAGGMSCGIEKKAGHVGRHGDDDGTGPRSTCGRRLGRPHQIELAVVHKRIFERISFTTAREGVTGARERSKRKGWVERLKRLKRRSKTHACQIPSPTRLRSSTTPSIAPAPSSRARILPFSCQLAFAVARSSMGRGNAVIASMRARVRVQGGVSTNKQREQRVVARRVPCRARSREWRRRARTGSAGHWTVTATAARAVPSFGDRSRTSHSMERSASSARRLVAVVAVISAEYPGRHGLDDYGLAGSPRFSLCAPMSSLNIVRFSAYHHLLAKCQTFILPHPTCLSLGLERDPGELPVDVEVEEAAVEAADADAALVPPPLTLRHPQAQTPVRASLRRIKTQWCLRNHALRTVRCAHARVPPALIPRRPASPFPADCTLLSRLSIHSSRSTSPVSQGHHPALRTRISTFTDSLLMSEPPIPGLDPSIIIAPRRLHLTLGVMSLTPAAPANEGTGALAGAASGLQSAEGVGQAKTLEAARNLLASLRPRVLELLQRSDRKPAAPVAAATGKATFGDGRLHVPLACVDIMNPERGDLEGAHILYAGPRMPVISSRKGMAKGMDGGGENHVENQEWDRLWGVACEFCLPTVKL